MATKHMKVNPELLAYLHKLLAAGFDVYLPVSTACRPEIRYANFVKDDRIGYVQCGTFYGLDFSTVRKPSREHGSGTSRGREQVNPSVKSAESCLLGDGGAMSKYVYRNWSEFARLNDWCGRRQLTLEDFKTEDAGQCS